MNDGEKYGPSPRLVSEKLADFLPPAIIVACVYFNFFLCFLNTNVFSVSPIIIVACEIVLTGFAVARGFYRIDRVKLFWLAVLAAQIMLIVILSTAKGEILIKPLRDIIIMPVFIVLGLSCYKIDFTKTVMFLSITVLIVALIEAFMTAPYLSLFNIREFYVAKGMIEGDVKNTALDVFASGERPSGRFLLDVPGIHRISSVFLEPVSLGFFAMIAGMYLIAVRDSISRLVYYSGLSISMALIWLSDARMALGAFALTFLLRPLFVRMDHRLSVLVLPLMLLIAYTMYLMNLFPTTGEGLGARMDSTFKLLSHTTLEIFFGVAYYQGGEIADSGLGYMLQGQGIFGILLFWLPPILFMKSLPKEARVFLFGISLYIGFGMMLTQAFFTIKTAALLWFAYGYMISRRLRDDNGNYKNDA